MVSSKRPPPSAAALEVLRVVAARSFFALLGVRAHGQVVEKTEGLSEWVGPTPSGSTASRKTGRNT